LVEAERAEVMPKKLITLEELSERLQVKKSWLYEKTRLNEIPYIKVGKYIRFVEDEIWKWLAGKRGGR